MGCRVCAHAERSTIEAEASSPGADVRHVAVRFGLTRAALSKHLGSHARAVDASSALPATTPRGRRQRAPSPAATEPTAPSTTTDRPRSASDDADGPPTVQSRREQPSPLDNVVRIQRTIDELLEQARSSAEATFAEKASLVRAALSANRQLSQLRGDVASEARLLASPIVQRFLAEILEALKEHPAASRAVLERVAPHREAAA